MTGRTDPPTRHRNPFRASSLRRRCRDRGGHALFAFCTYFILACAAWIFLDIAVKGLPVLFKAEPPFVNISFLLESPETLVVFTDQAGNERQMPMSEFTAFRQTHPEAVLRDEHTHSYSAGGIAGPLVGTAFLVLICMVVALLAGVSSAIYLSEYARRGRFLSAVRLAIMNLAGVPSIVFGLFGLGIWVDIRSRLAEKTAPAQPPGEAETEDSEDVSE